MEVGEISVAFDDFVRCLRQTINSEFVLDVIPDAVCAGDLGL